MISRQRASSRRVFIVSSANERRYSIAAGSRRGEERHGDRENYAAETRRTRRTFAAETRQNTESLFGVVSCSTVERIQVSFSVLSVAPWRMFSVFRGVRRSLPA